MAKANALVSISKKLCFQGSCHYSFTPYVTRTISSWRQNIENKNRSGRYFCSQAKNVEVDGWRPATGQMDGWQANEYDGEVFLSSLRVPPVGSNEVLVKVSASSVNPLDIAMLGGYGASAMAALKLFDGLKKGKLEPSQPEFPLIVGRDFCGEVEAVGVAVKEFRQGDRVMGAISPQRQGSHAQYVVAPHSTVCHTTSSLKEVEAAALPYACLTALSALKLSAGIWRESATGCRVLLLGASGGVGTILTQILRAWGAQVTGVCSSSSHDLVASLGALELYDYSDPATESILCCIPSYDLILDASGSNSLQYLKALRSGCSYVTFTSPLLTNTDSLGLLGGLTSTVANIAFSNASSIANNGVMVKYAYYNPDVVAVCEMQRLVNRNQLVGVVDKIFSFADTPAAYEKVRQGPNRGKTLIAFINDPSTEAS